MPKQRNHRQWYAVYALVTGVAGILILAHLFARQEEPIDLGIALLFAVVALVVSYFRVPVRSANSEIGLDGGVLLGAALLGGPALGGWVAFIAGLIKSFFPRRAERAHWIENATTALWSSGRNVLAIAAAWGAYDGMGGPLAPTSVTPSLALALVVLCVVFTLVRCFAAWPALVLQSGWSKRALRDAVNATTFLLELAPLPSALLIAATAAELGTVFFLLLALVFIGLGAVMRRMLDIIGALRKERDTLAFASYVHRAFAMAPADIQALCDVAYQLCAEWVPSARFEIGLYNTTEEDLHIVLAVHNETPGLDENPAEGNGQPTRLPSMRVPVPPLWEWIRERYLTDVVIATEGIDDVPAAAPQQESTRSLLIAPLLKSRGTTAQEAADGPEAHPALMGAIVLHAPLLTDYEEQDTATVGIVSEALSAALQNRPVQLPGESTRG